MSTQSVLSPVRASAVATFTASVVVPTPPFAPTNANTWPPTGALRCAITREMAPPSCSAVSGSATHSFTPERIASRISAGGSSDATRITLVVGC